MIRMQYFHFLKQILLFIKMNNFKAQLSNKDFRELKQSRLPSNRWHQRQTRTHPLSLQC